jgi:hypothetical protein
MGTMGEIKREDSQPVSPDLNSLLAPLQALQNLLRQFQERGVIIATNLT